jgi:hypothetical protein
MYNDEFDVELSEDELLSPVELGNAYQEGLDGTEKHFDFSGSIGFEDRHNPNAPQKRGFKNVQKSIAKKQGIPMKRAGAILAAGTRKASPAAKRKNPRLKRVRGKA